MALSSRVVASLKMDESTLDLDSHTDTSVAGANSHLLYDFDRTVRVTPYDPTMPGSNKKIVSVSYAYDDPTTGEVWQLVVNQAIYAPTMPNSLLCPMQMRMNDVVINECPRCVATDPTDDTHTIRARGMDGTITRIPLTVKGVTSCVLIRKTNETEYLECKRNKRIIELTAEDPVWDPHDTQFERAEDALTEADGGLREARGHDNRLISVVRQESLQLDERVYDANSQCSAVLTEMSPTLHDGTFMKALNDNRNVGAATSKRRTGLAAEDIARHWNIPIPVARRTIEVTTQRGVRKMYQSGELVRRVSTNDRHLRYRRLPFDMYTDTLFAGTKSKRGNKCAQVFGTNFGWSRAYGMKSKGDAHEPLSEIFRDVGVPNAMIMDGAKEQIMGNFRRKCREAGCYGKQTEPHSQWSNATEGTVRELKRGSARAMLKTGSPKRLWDDCIELQAFIKSNTYSDHFLCEGQTPETIVTGDTPDITPFVQAGWYDWVWYFDTDTQYLDDKQQIGR